MLKSSVAKCKFRFCGKLKVEKPDDLKKPLIKYVPNRPFRWFLSKKSYYDGIQVLERFVEPFIQETLDLSQEELERLSKSDQEFTFLHNLALMTRDRKVIRDQILSILMAGRDTTAGTLSWTMYELSNKPQIYEKLRKEVLEHIGSSGTPNYEDLKACTYLRYTISETLRLYPAVAVNTRACCESTSPMFKARW